MGLRFFVLLFICFVSCNNRQEAPDALAENKNSSLSSESTTITNTADTALINKIIRNANLVLKVDMDSAIALYYLAIERCSDKEYPEALAAAYSNLNYCYYHKKDFVRARQATAQMNNALLKIPGKYYKASRHRIFLGAKYNNAAQLSFSSSDYGSAATMYVKAIQTLMPADSVTYSTLGFSYMGMGALNARLGNSSSALSYFNKTEKLARQFKDSSLFIYALSNKATLLTDQKQYAKARSVALNALDILKRIDQDHSYFQLSNTIAICLINENKPEDALRYSKMVMELAMKDSSPENLISANYILGYNYTELGQYKTAERYLQQGLQAALKMTSMDNIDNAYGQLAVAYEGMGQYNKALQYQKRYTTVKDSLLGLETAGRIAEIETRYRVALKDNELARKDKALLQNQLKIARQQRQQYIWIGGASFCIITLLGLLRHKYYKAKLNQIKDTITGEERERRRLARELHDGIVSRLSIIKMNFSSLPLQHQYLNDTSDFQDVVNQLEQSIAELRTTSHDLLPEHLQRAGLAASVKVYCDKIRRLTPLDIEFQMLGDLPLLNNDFQLNIYRIIQEQVKNMVKHSNASQALIQFRVQKDWLNITIDDNGMGAQGEPVESTGLALKNLNDRIRVLNGTIEIERTEGTSVYLEFDMKKFTCK